MAKKTGKRRFKALLIHLVSSANTGFRYVMKKNPRRTKFKIELRKYDPVVNRHVLFQERKFK